MRSAGPTISGVLGTARGAPLSYRSGQPGVLHPGLLPPKLRDTSRHTQPHTTTQGHIFPEPHSATTYTTVDRPQGRYSRLSQKKLKTKKGHLYGF